MVRGATGDVFKFDVDIDKGFYLLAQVAAGEFNLISLSNGNRKTSSWRWPGGSRNVRIPVKVWEEIGDSPPVNCGPIVSFLVNVEMPVTIKVATNIEL